MPDGTSVLGVDAVLTRSPSPSFRTRLEEQLERSRAAFAAQARYPLREYAVVTPEQLAALRAQLGSGAPFQRGWVSAPLPPRWDSTERSPLNDEQLRAARAAAGYGAPAPVAIVGDAQDATDALFELCELADGLDLGRVDAEFIRFLSQLRAENDGRLLVDTALVRRMGDVRRRVEAAVVARPSMTSVQLAVARAAAGYGGAG